MSKSCAADLMQIAHRLITAALVYSPKATQKERDGIDVDVVLVEAIDDLRAIQRARQNTGGEPHPADEGCI